ncbi:MAG TPA: dTDP-4-dehydrorhamnose reductase [Thermodesulfobacteriota bacterium]|nr:dTDP-4-dehydrorhamnose reductase [Thermodesulfobacteriota bacterium]
MKKVLIIGADGMLGGELFRTLTEKDECIGSTIQELDISDYDRTIETIKKLEPQVVINVAAFTMVDLCEQEKEKAFAANVEGAKNVAIGCRETGAKCIYLSTDYVFDGKKNTPYGEDDPPNPISVYGLSKFQGEKYIEEILDDYLIIRSSWLFAKEGTNFINMIIKLSREKNELTMVNDQKGSPTYTKDLSQAISLLVEKDLKGIFHITNSGCCTWFEFAQKILDLIGSSMELIPISSSHCGRAAQRPCNSVLNCEKFIEKTGMIMPHWEDALACCIKTIKL